MNKQTAIAATFSFKSASTYDNIHNAVQPELDCITEMQQTAVGGHYRPEVAVRMILELEAERERILTACQALQRAVNKANERVQRVLDDAS